MNYTEEMILRSDSGYCMPFEERDKNVELSLGYGNQRHPVSGETFFHHGLDFNATRYLLSALATGTVSGVGRDNEHGIYQVIRYGKYEVKYSHLADVYANFGQNVQAGMMVALSGDLLHLEVRFNGEEMNPIDFLSMLFSNIKAIEHNGSLSFPEFENFEMNTPTNYEKDKNEIEELMMHFLPTYLMDLHRGQYILPERTEQSLRNIFSLSASKKYFFDSMPSMANPLGIGQRAMPLVCKVQNLLIGDFLNYLALRHNVYLSTMNDVLKKKSSTKP